jgi:hypothetical protein
MAAIDRRTTLSLCPFLDPEFGSESEGKRLGQDDFLGLRSALYFTQ